MRRKFLKPKTNDKPTCIPVTHDGEAMKKSKNNTLKITLLVLAAALTLLVTLMPNFHPEKQLGLNYHWQLDVLFHSGYYLVLTLALRFLLTKPHNNFIFLGLLLLTATALELLQIWVPHRAFSKMDMASNGIGIVLGGVIYSTLLKKNS